MLKSLTYKLYFSIFCALLYLSVYYQIREDSIARYVSRILNLEMFF